jgi:methyl-accepting chemotaxis protein
MNTDHAIKVDTESKSSQRGAEQGNTRMKELVAAMNDINTNAVEIRKVIQVIDDIAFQINLLALNANVEAARAGKYGKGFAVVAEEVRNLAVRSAKAVQDTAEMIESTIKSIGKGNSLVDLTATQLATIVSGAAEVAQLAEQVCVASKEQTMGLEQVSTGLNQIDQVTQSNTASAEQSAAAAEELSGQAQMLKNLITQFKLKGSTTEPRMYLVGEKRGIKSRVLHSTSTVPV